MMRKLAWLAVAAIAVIGAGTANAQQTPRKGGTLRMTAPYAASFGSLDPHVTPRAQDDIVGKALQRSLYNWDTAANKLSLELAKSVSVSAKAPNPITCASSPWGFGCYEPVNARGGGPLHGPASSLSQEIPPDRAFRAPDRTGGTHRQRSGPRSCSSSASSGASPSSIICTPP